MELPGGQCFSIASASKRLGGVLSPPLAVTDAKLFFPDYSLTSTLGAATFPTYGFAMAIQVITDPRCTEYSAPGHPERPQRISATTKLLSEQKELSIEWLKPLEVDEVTLALAHDPGHIKRLDQSWDFDADTPAHPNIAQHARRAAGGAVHAMQHALKGQTAFSLLRPPGHHATSDQAMGFCYLCSIAIAILAGQKAGKQKVAVFDFDVHHGNGTEAILLDRKDTLFISVHQFPAYPGTGKEHRTNSRNYPVRPGASRDEYRAALTKALKDLTDFKPDLIGVSAGFDAYKDDPLSDAPLIHEDYHWLGSELKGMKVPFFSVLEGGYSGELPQLIFSYLKGISGQPLNSPKPGSAAKP